MEIRLLNEGDSEAFWKFRLLALESEPTAFGEAAAEHRSHSVSEVADRLKPDPAVHFVVGGFEGGKLVGTAGFYREMRQKRLHKGNVWGVFVAREHRGRGIAKQLLERLIETACSIPELVSIRLSVATSQAAARQLYRSLGFEPYGIEPRSLKVDSRFVDEEHMVLNILQDRQR